MKPHDGGSGLTVPKPKKRYGNRRFMGKPHQVRVSKNPLHYTSKLERLQRCTGECGELLDKCAFVRPNGDAVDLCPTCYAKKWAGSRA